MSNRPTLNRFRSSTEMRFGSKTPEFDNSVKEYKLSDEELAKYREMDQKPVERKGEGAKMGQQAKVIGITKYNEVVDQLDLLKEKHAKLLKDYAKFKENQVYSPPVNPAEPEMRKELQEKDGYIQKLEEEVQQLELKVRELRTPFDLETHLTEDMKKVIAERDALKQLVKVVI